RLREHVGAVRRGVPARAAAGGDGAVREICAELAQLGSSTVFEASGREGLVDVALERIVPGSRAAGPARTVRCGAADNLMVHAAVAQAGAGDGLVLTLPEPGPTALMGDLLARQAEGRGGAAGRWG